MVRSAVGPPGPGRHAERAQRGRPLMRVGLVCPYSLSVPGGVQAQVIGFARELRRQGHEARVLGPWMARHPRRSSRRSGTASTAANGSMAPLAPDASAALRTIRALRDEQFDVLHVHEPLAPGPTMTTVTLRRRRWSRRSTPPVQSTSYRCSCAVLTGGWPPHRPQGRRLQGRPRAGADEPRVASTSCSTTASTIEPFSAEAVSPDHRPHDLLRRAPRAPQGLAVPIEALLRLCRRRPPVDRRRRAPRDRVAARRAWRATSASSGSAA